MKLIFEYEQADGQIDGLAAKAAFEAAINTAGWRCELDKARSTTVMRVAPLDVTLENFRIQQTMCDVKLRFERPTEEVEEIKAATTRPSPDQGIARALSAQPPSVPALEDGSRNKRPTGRGAR